MPERWARHACIALAVLALAVCALLAPAARTYGACLLHRGGAEPAQPSSVRLLGGLAGLAAVTPLLVLDGRADRFALHAPAGADLRALEALAVEAVGGNLPPLVEPVKLGTNASQPAATLRPPDWSLRVAQQRRPVDSTCSWTMDAPPPPPSLTRLGGLTLIAHDTAIAVAHYFHVIEHLLALWALRATFYPTLPATRLLLIGRTQDYDIAPAAPKGRFMRLLVAALFPNATIVRPSEWRAQSRRSALLIEHAAVSSRMTCQRHASSFHLNKMLAAHAASLRPHASDFRDALLRGLGVRLPPKHSAALPAGALPLGPGGARADGALAVQSAPGAQGAQGSQGERAVQSGAVGQSRRLRVGLVDRGKSNRRLSAEFKAALLAALQADARFDSFLLRFQDLKGPAAQAQAAAELDIMIGCHGNGLTHALLMRPPAVMVELFPANINHADYQLHAEYSGHRHFGWSDRDGLLRRSPYVAQCAQKYGVYAHYRRKSDRSVFRGVGGNATIARLIELAHALALAPEDEWRGLVAPAGDCAPDGRM